ncbi:MAG: TlpA disulfide reductase family protein [Pseudomonadota bacterium]
MTVRNAIAAMFGIGLLAVVYVIFAAARNPGSADRGDLAIGAMADFIVWDRPRPGPELGFTGAEGEDVTIADFRGEAVLLNLWATWCAPCIEEMPALQALQEDLSGESFRIAAVSVDREGARKVTPFVDQLGVENLSIYFDPTMAFARSLKVQAGIPVTILFDPRGREVGRVTGIADWDTPEAKTLIASVLPEQE